MSEALWEKQAPSRVEKPVKAPAPIPAKKATKKAKKG